jgi:hypothetical protein
MQVGLALLRAETGWLWQANDFDVAKIPNAKKWRVEPDERKLTRLRQWRLHLEGTRRALLDELKRARADAEAQAPKEITRARYASYERLLERDEPLTALMAIERRMEATFVHDAPHLSTVTRAIRQRDLMLFKMLIRMPLRVRQFAEMTWRNDNTGMLRRLESGDFEVVIDGVTMKATPSHRRGDFRYPLPADLTRGIRELLDNRKHLAGQGFSEYVFRPRNRTTKGRSNAHKTLVSISDRLCEAITAYIPEEWGLPRAFRMHAVRHILATHFVKTAASADEGFALAADLLARVE